MKNRKGLTLIEVLLALVLLSILLITYITVFGQNALLVSKGKRITNQTFDYQELMENNMVNTKKEFSSNNSMVKDGEIEIFSSYPNYKTKIDIKKVETKINENRKYTAFLSRFEIKEPEPPKLDPFTVKIYNKGKTKEAFPWFEDEIRLIGEYNLHGEPKIFENTTRWYRSLEDEINPVFSSDYGIVEATDKTVQEPESKNYNDELISKERLAKRFYYFEARPYSFAGRIEHYRNEDRILVLNRAGSKEWQDFMEDIYFKTTNVKRFATNSQEIYLDIFQNPNHPTLNLDWQENKDPEAALLGMKIPDEYKSKNFETRVDFQFEDQRLNDSKELGIGIGLVDKNNTGIIIDIEPIKNLINFRFVKNGKRDSSKPTSNLSELNQDMEVDWKEKITLSIAYNSDKIVLQLSNESKSSKIMEVPATGINPEFVGLKSYSTTNYMPDLKYEIYNKYDRNYSSHFYNIEFRELENQKDEHFGMFMFGGGLNIAASDVLGENKSIFFDSDLNLDNVKNNGHIKVSTIYVKENLILPSGSNQLGLEKNLGEIHVNGNFIESGSRIIYGDVFVGKDFESKSSSTTINGDLHVGGNLKLWDGSMKINGNIYVGGNLELKDAHINGDVYINGNIKLEYTPTLSASTKIYRKPSSTLEHPENYNNDILSKIAITDNIILPKQPNVPEPLYPNLKKDSWYVDNGYVNSLDLRNNIKIYTNSFTKTTHTNSISDIIIVAKTGNIRIENFGGSTIKGILFAPNGSVYLNGGNFEGLIIAKCGLDYVQGGGFIKLKSIDELISNPADYPFQ